MMYGSESSVLSRLYKKGNRNLVGIADSRVPETLATVLKSAHSEDVRVAVIEAIAHSALYEPTAKLFAPLAVLR